MKNAFIIHASFSGPEQHWYPWLASELEQASYTVFVPRFPTPEHQSYDAWLQVFNEYRQHINEETIFIGHSVGCAFILRILQEQQQTVAGCVFVAPFAERLAHEGLNLVSATFVSEPFDWHQVHAVVGHVVALASDNDPFVAVSFSQSTAELLGVSLTTVSGAGHFTEGDGWTQAPDIRNAIEEIITPPPSEEEQAYTSLNEELEAAGIDVSVVPSFDTQPKNDAAYSGPKDYEPIETMYEDIADTINTADAKFMADMLHEEREKEVIQREKRKSSYVKMGLAIAALILVIVGIGFITRGLSVEPPPVEIVDAVQVPSIIRADDEIGFDISNFSNVFTVTESLRGLVGQFMVPSKQVMNIYPGQQGPLGARLSTLGEFFNVFEIILPTQLQQALTGEFMYGILGGESQDLFLLLTINSIDRAFVGMRDWETTMVRDLEGPLLINEEVKQPSLYEETFDDATISNFPVRVLRAPTVERIVDTRWVEDPTTITITRSLPSETLDRIQEVTDTAIVFAEPDPFLTELVPGDIITAPATPLSGPLIRRVENFALVDEVFQVLTTSLTLSDIIPDVPENAELIVQPDSDGTVRRSVRYQEETVSFIEGAFVPVLFYLFVDDEHILVTTDIVNLDLVVERLGQARGEV